MTLLEAISAYLIQEDIAAEDNIFRDFTPEAPDHVVMLKEYTGSPDVQHEEAVHRSVQFSVRDVSPIVAKSKATLIYKRLKTANRIVHFTDEWWGQVFLRQPPFKIKVDANERVLYGFNTGITTRID